MEVTQAMRDTCNQASSQLATARLELSNGNTANSQTAMADCESSLRNLNGMLNPVVVPTR